MGMKRGLQIFLEKQEERRRQLAWLRTRRGKRESRPDGMRQAGITGVIRAFIAVNEDDSVVTRRREGLDAVMDIMVSHSP